MLSSTTSQVGLLTRNVVLRHPNSFYCLLYRKVVTRPNSGMFRGTKPKYGNVGSLDTDDEPEYRYDFKGQGKALWCKDIYQPSPIVDHNDATTGASDEFVFLIEPLAQSGEEGWFDVKTHDVIYLLIWMPGNENPAKLAFEVVGRESVTNIPPYNTRYICNRRDDLHLTVNNEYLSDIIPYPEEEEDENKDPETPSEGENEKTQEGENEKVNSQPSE